MEGWLSFPSDSFADVFIHVSIPGEKPEAETSKPEIKNSLEIQSGAV